MDKEEVSRIEITNRHSAHYVEIASTRQIIRRQDKINYYEKRQWMLFLHSHKYKHKLFFTQSLVVLKESLVACIC